MSKLSLETQMMNACPFLNAECIPVSEVLKTIQETLPCGAVVLCPLEGV